MPQKPHPSHNPFDQGTLRWSWSGYSFAPPPFPPRIATWTSSCHALGDDGHCACRQVRILLLAVDEIPTCQGISTPKMGENVRHAKVCVCWVHAYLNRNTRTYIYIYVYMVLWIKIFMYRYIYLHYMYVYANICVYKYIWLCMIINKCMYVM
jgi:hypothetical protein